MSMQLSYKDKPHSKIECFPLPSGYVDVFLHKNEKTEVDEEGNTVYKAEEVYFQTRSNITKEMIEDDFDSYWENEGERIVNELTATERIETLEDAILFMLMGGM